ncbi:MAG: hypothetical protein MUF34_36425, partial [Polyangiaceae bacterium]|nr:hypothetical protein [Polyangiaceae bacterium]
MTALLQAIGELVRPGLMVDGSPIRLEETDPGSTCKPVTLSRTGPALVLKLDVPFQACPRPGCQLTFAANDRIFPLFRTDQKGFSAVCDYIIFCQEQSPSGSATYYALLCELKSGGVTGSMKQLENACLLIDYIIAMAQHHSSLGGRLSIEKRGIVFSTRFAVPKGQLRKNRCQYQAFGARPLRHL